MPGPYVGQPAQLVDANGNPLTSVPADGYANTLAALQTLDLSMVYRGDGTWDRMRGPTTFKSGSVSVTAGTPQTIWTPATGKRFRLMGGNFNAGSSSIIILKDAGTEIARAAGPVAGGGQGTLMGLVNGILSALANNVLGLDIVAGAGVLCHYFVFGTEE